MSTSYSSLPSNDLDSQLGLADEPMSTPIQHPQQEQQAPHDNVNMLVDSVMSQAERDQEYHQNDSNINGEFLNHQLDHSQMPFEQDFPQQYQQQQHHPAQHYQMMPQEQIEPPTLVEKLTNDGKLASMMMVLFVVLSLPQFNQFLTKFFPRFLSETGGLTMAGLAVKAVLAGLLFMLVKFFAL